MNGFRLLALRLRQYIVNNKLIVALFLFSSIFNTLIVLYSYGNFLPEISNRYSSALFYRLYQVELGSKTTADDVAAFAEDPLIAACALAQDKGVHGCIGSFPFTYLSGSGEFTEPYQAIQSYYPGNYVHYSRTLQGQEFSVVGTFTEKIDLTMIPFETYLKLYGPEKVTRLMVLAKTQQNAESDRVEALIRQHFPHVKSVARIAKPTVTSDRTEAPSKTALIAFNAILAVIANTLLLHRILSTRRAENAVSRIVGAPRTKLAALLFTEAFVLSAVPISLAALMHRVFYNALFLPLSLYDNIRYLPEDYLRVNLFLLILSCAAAVPIVWKEALLSPDAAKRKTL